MAGRHKIPLAVKVAYTIFVAILVPNYWRAYSPWTFLYFCDVALFLTLPALWLESPLLISLPAVGLTLPQLLWVIDFVSGSRTGLGMTSYMYDPNIPLLVRGLSTFHGWLPFLMVWGVWRLGYDRRALAGWIVISTAILLSSYFLAPAPPAPVDNPNLAVNINYVHGMIYKEPQSFMAPMLWLTAMIVGFPLVFYVPAHLIFRSFFPSAPAPGGSVSTATVLPDQPQVLSPE
jgi:hypothetical protein